MRLPLLSCLLVFLLCPGLVYPQDGAFNLRSDQQLSEAELLAMLPDSIHLFDRDEPLEITLVSDFKMLEKNKFGEDYQEAIMQYMLNDSILIKKEVRIRPRGNTRRKICSSPPIKLNFKHTDFHIEELKQLEKLKMVTQCSPGRRFEDYLLREFLVYKILNQLTARSFKVRLIRLKYVDTGRRGKTSESWAFIIEDVRDAADRLGAKYIKSKNLGQANINEDHMTLVSVFQFMVANTDWSIAGTHNMKLMAVKKGLDEDPIICLPYDFDYAGLVDADYAIPTKGLHLKSVRERKYVGYCYPEADFEKAFQLFREAKPKIFAYIHDFEPLEERDRKHLVDFLEEFYFIIDRPSQVRHFFLDDCKHLPVAEE